MSRRDFNGWSEGGLGEKSGCPLNGPDNCSNGTADLGSYPSDFIDLVKVEGTGRIDVNPAQIASTLIELGMGQR